MGFGARHRVERNALLARSRLLDWREAAFGVEWLFDTALDTALPQGDAPREARRPSRDGKLFFASAGPRGEEPQRACRSP